jgi:hypothetical protein
MSAIRNIRASYHGNSKCDVGGMIVSWLKEIIYPKEIHVL